MNRLQLNSPQEDFSAVGVKGEVVFGGGGGGGGVSMRK